MSNVLQARLAILPFALIQWTVVVVYLKLMMRPGIAQPLRVLLALAFVVSVAGTVFGQLDIYTAITGESRPLDADNFVFGVVLVESLVAVVIGVRMVLRRWRASRPMGD